MLDILKKVQVNVPFHLLYKKHFTIILKKRINPEIGLNYFTLNHFKKEDFFKTANTIIEAGLTITMHAPFMDLRPGAIDPKIRQVSIDRLNQFFELVPYFQPKLVVCHASFDERYYVGSMQRWLENSIETWRQFLPLAREMNTVIALENVYENSSHYLTLLLDSLNSPHICFCFDAGHFNAFSGTSLEEWMNRLEPFLK
jgi:sugar phosphate isomerase/epimerase